MVSIPEHGVVPLPRHVAAGYRRVLQLDPSGQQQQFVAKNVFGVLEQALGKSAFAVYIALKRRELVVPLTSGPTKSGSKKFTIVRRQFTLSNNDYTPRSKVITTVKSKQLFLSGILSIGYEFLLSLDPKKVSKEFELVGVSSILGKRFGGNRASHIYSELKRRGLVKPGRPTDGLKKNFIVVRAPYQVLGGKPGFELAPPKPKEHALKDNHLGTLHQYFISNHRFIAELERKKSALKRLGYIIVMKDGELLLKRL